MRDLILTEIWIYPIKSLGGIPLPQARVFEKGLEYDRRWMLVNADYVFMTQREKSTLALFKQTIAGNNLVITRVDPTRNERPSISFPLNSISKGERTQARIFDDTVTVAEVDPKLSEWFSQQLQMTCRLVSFAESDTRPIDRKYHVNNENVSLADAYPFLIIGQSSLNDLNSRLEKKLPMNRFRPNFVFTGGSPFEEDSWRNFTIGTNRFIGVKPCARCVVPTVDQDTAEKGIEPTYTLAKFRKKDAKVLFGQNLVAVDHGVVKIGDKISIQ